MTENKVDKLLKFLKSNRKFPLQVQEQEYSTWLGNTENDYDKAYSLLFHLFYTQSQPKLNLAAGFFSMLSKDNLLSFEAFLSSLPITTKSIQTDSSKTSYKKLFQKLSASDGWGFKTAALFVKAVYEIHSSERFSKYRFWSDLPSSVDGDLLYLPVDEVIKYIFSQHLNSKLNSFETINEYLHYCNVSFEDIKVLDDLWYWGFITQQTSKEVRETVSFNEGKYWTLIPSTQAQIDIENVKSLALEFRSILMPIQHSV